MLDGIIPDLKKSPKPQERWRSILPTVMVLGRLHLPTPFHGWPGSALATGRFVVFWALGERLGIEVDLIDFGSVFLISIRSRTNWMPIMRKAIRLFWWFKPIRQVQSEMILKRFQNAFVLQVICLLLVDCMASLACDQFEMDSWGWTWWWQGAKRFDDPGWVSCFQSTGDRSS